jgi:uncharacterized OB-fold protein
VSYPSSSAEPERPRNLPDVTAPAMAPFWEAAQRHVLMAQRCQDCGDTRFPPLELCPACWSVNQAWVEIAPEGELWSYVVYHRALDPSKAQDLPYVVGRVVTDSSAIFTVRLDLEPEAATVGMRVKASWDDVTDEVTLLRFTAP